MRPVYTEIKPTDVMESRGLVAALFDDALSDNSPLFRTISRSVNESMLVAPAAAYDSG